MSLPFFGGGTKYFPRLVNGFHAFVSFHFVLCRFVSCDCQRAGLLSYKLSNMPLFLLGEVQVSNCEKYPALSDEQISTDGPNDFKGTTMPTHQTSERAKRGEPIIEIQDAQTGKTVVLVYAWNNGQVSVASNSGLKVVELSPAARLRL